jgi:hypothetical protein
VNPETRTKLVVVVLGAVALSVAAFTIRRGRDEKHEEEARPLIPLAAPAAQGPAGVLNEAEVAAAYHAYFGGGGDARAQFAEIVRKLARPVEPGLPANIEVVTPELGGGALLRAAVREGGVLLADVASGTLLAWTNEGARALSRDSFGPLVFEEHAEEAYSVLDPRAGRVLAELEGQPVAVSGDGAVHVFTRTNGDASVDVVLRVWDVRAGREKRALSFPATDPYTPPSLSAQPWTTGAVVSEKGRWILASVDLGGFVDRPTRLAVWDGASGRLVAQPALRDAQLAAIFAKEERAIFAMLLASPNASGEDRVGVARLKVPEGVVEGPFVDCDARGTAMLSGRALALSSDGKYLAVGGTEDVCIYQASPLRFLWKTPVVRPLGPVDDDLGGTWPRFVLNDKVVLVTSDGPPSVAAFKVSDHSEIARGPVALSLPDRVHVTRSITAARVLLVVEDATGAPMIVDIDGTGAARARKFTIAEREGETEPPELAGAVPDLDDAQAREDRVRDLVSKRVCHIGELVLPTEVCGG